MKPPALQIIVIHLFIVKMAPVPGQVCPVPRARMQICAPLLMHAIEWMYHLVPILCPLVPTAHGWHGVCTAPAWPVTCFLVVRRQMHMHFCVSCGQIGWTAGTLEHGVTAVVISADLKLRPLVASH